MSRPLRIEHENAWYHVMNRGIARQNIYHTLEHREMFLALLGEIYKKFYVEIHAYCLMDNHYHLLVRTPIPNLGRAMRHLDGLYTRRFNVCQGRDGSIFRGRYHAILIEEEAYLLKVSRYIHLNPVVARICHHPEEYRWSSYHQFLTKNKLHKWLRTENILSYFDNSDSTAYAEFVSEGVEDELKLFYQGPLKTILGSETFISQKLEKVTEEQKKFCKRDLNRFQRIHSVDGLLNIIKKYFNIKFNELIYSKRGNENIPRLLAIYFLRQYGQLSHQEIANYFLTIQPKSVGNLIGRLELRLVKEAKLQKLVEDISCLIETGKVGEDT